MKTMIRIARLNLAALFYSPIAWFLMIIFLFQCGLTYLSAIEDLVTRQELGGNVSFFTFLTEKIFAPPFGIMSDIMSKLYLYLPLLTMGLMSRELSSGTIKLLYSSPVTVREIVLGKFLALMAYNLLLTMIFGVIVLLTAFNIQNADTGMLLSAMLGMYLLLCAYAAIGLFMSCLTSYQVVAAISTLVVFAVLSYIGALWQDIDFVRDLTWFLSIVGRTEKMLIGLISSKDVLYFLIIIYIFLGFSIYKLRSERESISAWAKTGRYLLIFVTALGVGYISSRPALVVYYDATATKSRTLTKATRQIIREMGDEPLEVTSYINLMDGTYWGGRPQDRNVDISRWEPYLRFKPNIKFNYVYYYDSVLNDRVYKANPGMSIKQLAEKYAKSYKVDLSDFKTPEEMKKIVNLSPELYRYVMQLKYKGKTTFLRLYEDRKIYPGETETAAALKRLMTKLPVIAFLEGEEERSVHKMGDRDYKTLTNLVTFRFALINQGFDIMSVALDQQEIPGDIAALVIADPTVPFTPKVLAKIQQYISDGGNVLIASEPGHQEIVNPLLQPLGITLMEGTLTQKSRDFAPDLALPYITTTVATFTNALKRDYEDSMKIAMPGATGIAYDTTRQFDIQPLLMTSQGITPAVKLTRTIDGKEQRIIVLGDADCMNNMELGRRNIKTANFNFSTSLFSWLSYGEFPIDTTRPTSNDNKLNLTGKGVVILRIFLLGILPGILLIIGAVLLIRRKKR
ncbi:MAG: Gldg family protein [Chitinophagaceae bacterium]|nr:Gldg family protein [Chitinophagaceae bacterium]